MAAQVLRPALPAAAVAVAAAILAALASLPAVAPLAVRWTPMLAAAAAGVGAVALLVRARRAPRAPWLLLGLALTWSFMGWAFTAASVLAGAPAGAFLPFADVVFLTGYGLLLAGLGTFLMGVSRQERIRRGIDALALSCTLAAIAWVVVLRGLVDRSGLPLVDGVVSVAYPAMDLALVGAFLLLATEARVGTRAALVLLAAAAFALFLGDLAFAWASLHAGAPTGASAAGAAGVAWVAAYVFVALAARFRVPAEEAMAAPHPRAAMWMLIVPIAALLPLAVVDYAQQGMLDAVLFGLGVALVALLVLRQGLTLSDLHRSSAALRSTADDLLRERMQLARSESKFRTLAENFPDYITRVDREGRRVYSNPAVQRLWASVGAGDPTGTKVGDVTLTKAAGTQELRDALEASLADGRRRTLRQTVDTPQGTRHLDGTIVPERGPEGTVESVLLVARDVTEMQDAYAALRASEERFRLAGKATTDVIWDYDIPSGRLAWGASMEEIFGHRLQDLEPGLESWSRRVHPDDHDAVTRSFGEALAGTATKWNGAYRFRRASGEWAHVLDRCFIVRDAAGKPVRAVGSFSDVTDLLLAEREREAALQRAEDVHREAQRLKEMAGFKTQFLTNAAHELATPLTPLKLQLATMRPQLAAADPEGFRMLERNVQRLGTLVNDLLDAARLQAGHLRLQMAPVRLPELLGRVRGAFAPQAGHAGVTLGVLGAPPGLQAVCDETRVEQVLYNLVHNAVKFTPRGGQVWLSADLDGRDAVVTVRDTGIGLKPSQAQRLFQPFTQVHDPVQAPKAGGTGLGLYIAKGIAEQHGGSLHVESAGEGMGCAFTLRLPLAPATAGAAAPATAPGPPRAAAAPPARSARP